jgi:deoxycytidylate deaminase
MFYADNKCAYNEDATHYIFTGPCHKCKESVTVKILKDELYQYNQGKSIQNALSNPASEREFLMSGICGACFKKN